LLIVPLLDVPRELAPVRRPAAGAPVRRERGTRKGSRALTCFYQAVFALPGRTRLRPAGRPNGARSATPRSSPRKIGDIVKAALVLTHFEHGRLT
jgi:hypothetical protein